MYRERREFSLCGRLRMRICAQHSDFWATRNAPTERQLLLLITVGDIQKIYNVISIPRGCAVGGKTSVRFRVWQTQLAHVKSVCESTEARACRFNAKRRVVSRAAGVCVSVIHVRYTYCSSYMQRM